MIFQYVDIEMMIPAIYDLCVEFFAVNVGKEKRGWRYRGLCACVGDFYLVKKSPQLKSRKSTCHTILRRFDDKVCWSCGPLSLFLPQLYRLGKCSKSSQNTSTNFIKMQTPPNFLHFRVTRVNPVDTNRHDTGNMQKLYLLALIIFLNFQ